MDLSDIGARLRQAREERGWRLVDVAERAGLSASHIHNIEAGKLARHDRISQVAEVLGYRLEVITLLLRRGAKLRAVVLPVDMAAVLDDVAAMPDDEQEVLKALITACLSLEPRQRQLLRDQAEVLTRYRGQLRSSGEP